MEKLSNIHDLNASFEIMKTKIENDKPMAAYQDCLKKQQRESHLHIYVSSMALYEPKLDKFTSCFENNNNKAIESDWNIVRDDLINAIVKVLDDQGPDFKREFFKLIAKKMTDEKRRHFAQTGK